MSEKYQLLIYVCHSLLEQQRHRLLITLQTTVDNFRDTPENNTVCEEIFHTVAENFDYEVSYNQMSIAINYLLTAWNQPNYIRI